jgi:hypothetical protein
VVAGFGDRGRARQKRFYNVDPCNQPVLLGLDVSGSMAFLMIADSCIGPIEVSAAMALTWRQRSRNAGAIPARDSSLFFGANRGQQAFGASQLSLHAIAGEEDFAFQFKREGNMQQIESTATKPVGVAFGKSAGVEQCFVTIHRGFHKPSTFQPAFDSGKSGVSLAQNGRPYAAGERSPEMKRALPNRVRDFQRVERKKIQGREF